MTHRGCPICGTSSPVDGEGVRCPECGLVAGDVTGLEVARRVRGLSRDQLASASGVTERTIYGLEREGRTAHRATLAALAGAMNCETKEIG